MTANKKGEKSVILGTIWSEKSRITVMISVTWGEISPMYNLPVFIEAVDSGLNGDAITSMGNGVFLVTACFY